MGGDHEYGRGDAPRDGSRAYGTGRRGYGDKEPEDAVPGRDEASRGYGGRGYGDPQPPGQGPADTPPAGYGVSQDPYGGGYGAPQRGAAPASGGGRPDERGYGAAMPPQAPRGSQNPGSAPPARGYGSTPAGPASADARGYGPSSGYGQPVDAYGGAGYGSADQGRGSGHRRAAPGDVPPTQGTGPGTRRMPPVPGQGGDPGDFGGDPLPPRRSRVDERRAARGGEDYAPSQERSGRYERSPIDGRATRNGAGRRAGGPGGPGGPGGRAGNRPPQPKTGYHKYFDYPRTNKESWQRWAPSFKQVASITLGGFFLLIGLVAFEYETVQVPSPASISLQQSSIYQFADASTEIGTTGVTNREDVTYDQIPMTMQNAIVSQEDKTFWKNSGVSYTGTARALLVDLTGGSTQGGSTLTQQYVKNAFLSQAQTFSRKTDEIFISLKLAKQQPKTKILTEYLNTVFFGRNAYGIQAGTKAWLNQPMSALDNPANAALMAALVNEPTNFSLGWSPSEDPASRAQWQQALKVRWQDTLLNMKTYQYITAAQYQTAIAHFPDVITPTSTNGQTVEQEQMITSVDNWLDSEHTTDPTTPTSAEIATGGYTVVSTFNQQYMNLAAKAVQQELLSKLTPNNAAYAYDDSNLQPGLAAIDPSTGDLVAFYGGTSDYNNATQRQVQPGSTFKAFTLATAFNDGWSPDAFINGAAPWPQKTDPNYDEFKSDPTVKNDSSANGWMTLKAATDQSVNTAFVRLETDPSNGIDKVHQTASAFGLNANNVQGFDSSQGGCDNARLTLGICSATPARMASAYSAFADNGTLHPLTEVLKVIGPGGSVWTPQQKTQQPVQPNVAAEVTQMFEGVTHNSDGTAYGAINDSNVQNIAGKTGTSTMDLTHVPAADMKHLDGGNFTTAAVWFNGYTTKLEVAVAISRWVDVNGVATQLPVDNIHGSGLAFGAQYPMRIWADFMREMQSTKLGGDPDFPTVNPDPQQTILNSPSPTASPTPTATATPTVTATQPGNQPTDCSSSGNGNGNGGFLGGFGGGGNGGNQCPTATATSGSTGSPTSTGSPSSSPGTPPTPTPTSTRKRSGP